MTKLNAFSGMTYKKFVVTYDLNEKGPNYETAKASLINVLSSLHGLMREPKRLTTTTFLLICDFGTNLDDILKTIALTIDDMDEVYVMELSKIEFFGNNLKKSVFNRDVKHSFS